MKVIHLLRKPLSEGTVASNTLKHGVGGLNIDASRIGGVGGTTRTNGSNAGRSRNTLHGGNFGVTPLNAGRWPANVILQHLDGCRCDGVNWICEPGCPVPRLDEQSGVSKSTSGRTANISTTSTIYGGGKGLGQDLSADSVRGDPGFGDVGGASRFFKQVGGEK